MSKPNPRPSLEQLRARTTCTISLAAAFMNVSPSTAYRMANEGHLPTIKVGTTRRVPVPALLAMVGLTYEAKQEQPQPA